MMFVGSRLNRFPQVVLAVCSLTLSGLSPGRADDKEPIAYIGHGAFFDQEGRQITLTPDFVAKTQEWYRNKLLAALSPEKKARFAAFEKRLNAGLRVEGQARLVVQHRSLDWLVANSPQLRDDGRIIGKLSALESQLSWKLPEREITGEIQSREKFKLDPEIENKLKLPISQPGGLQTLSLTTNTGQNYLNECSMAQVPIPPPIGQMDPAGLTGWKVQGFIPPAEQFITGTPAEVRTFHSTSPPGMCIALPRYSDATKTQVDLDGVICLGQAQSKVCIWDNQMPVSVGGIIKGKTFSFAAGELIPIGVPNLAINPAGKFQGGGFDLNNGQGGVCTDCHAGQNPYIVHPSADLGGGVSMGTVQQPPLTSPGASSRYDPLVPASWPQNQLSQSPVLVPPVCSTCHYAGGSGGRFPHLSSELNGVVGYCKTILAQAIAKTMPPSDPGGEAANADVITFKNWCGTPASSGPSNRGDPHLTTTNGINYDFQSAGEFTALRNSDSQFELQTRQTAVSTPSALGPNAHTGLASCVSLNTAAAVRIGKHRITYQPDPRNPGSAERLQLRIDGVLARLPTRGMTLGYGNRIVRAASGGGLDITLADGTHLIITPNFWASQGHWYLNIEVLNTPAREGTMGHIPTADWLPLAPDGSSFGPAPASLADRHTLLNQKFASAWRVTDTTSLFDYALGTTTADFTDPDWPPMVGKPCTALNSTRPPVRPMRPETAQRMCRAIKDKAVFADCVFDLTATGEAAMVKAYLQTLKLREAATIAVPN